ncbi:carbon-nitrogen hydrolase family protein [uncultured Schumannella sp.]|uniref:carbon-nitrogen hydrolase family protein n=1 Tax=uncultured Schumannella sp. TaxID=1195956 RepID=UPI0025CE7A0B|nr:carbon-nitrogen hydrolase family protein [uncultured Schumannella sp.]
MASSESSAGAGSGAGRGSGTGSGAGAGAGARTVAVAVAQFAPGDDPAANLAEITRLAEVAVARGARLVVFPEYSSYFTAAMGPGVVPFAQEIEGEFTSALGAVARRLGIHLVAGMIEAVPGDTERVHNTLVAVDASGQVVASYRKMHLYDAFGQKESDWVVAGALEQRPVFAWEGFTVGLQTCYDVRFPEVTRRLVDAGADLVLLPAEWVRGPLKEHHWRTLVTARALENTIFVAAADHAPPVGAGNSMVVDPMGIELVTVGESVDVGVAWISPARVAEVRRVNPALALRRFGVGAIGE